MISVQLILATNFFLGVGWKLNFFEGNCRDGSNNHDFLDTFDTDSLDSCRVKCELTASCTAFAYLDQDGTDCNLYQGGPYTQGNGNSFKCYVVNKGKNLIYVCAV